MLAATMLAQGGMLAGSAHACFLVSRVVVTEDGRESPEEIARDNERRKREIRRVQLQQLRADVISGRIDSASGLADLLVPNVRNDNPAGSDCDPAGDLDGPDVSRWQELARVFEGTEIDGLDEELDGRISAAFLRGPLFIAARECNSEVRAGFASRLLREVPRRRRDATFLLLKAQALDERRGFYVFTTPFRDSLPQPRDVADPARGFLRDRADPVNRSLRRFWADTAPKLRDGARLCPAAHRALMTARDAEIARLRKRRGYLELLKRAEEGRTGRTAAPQTHLPLDDVS